MAPRSVEAFVQGMALVALGLVYHRSGVFGLEAVTDVAIFLLGGSLIVAGIAVEILILYPYGVDDDEPVITSCTLEETAEETSVSSLIEAARVEGLRSALLSARGSAAAVPSRGSCGCDAQCISRGGLNASVGSAPRNRAL